MLIDEAIKNDIKQENCSFCGENEPTGMWMGAKTIFCCKPCAHNYLPQLIANSIVGGTTIESIESGKKLPVEVTGENTLLQRFHSAFSTALIRKLRHRKKS